MNRFEDAVNAELDRLTTEFWADVRARIDAELDATFSREFVGLGPLLGIEESE